MATESKKTRKKSLFWSVFSVLSVAIPPYNSGTISNATIFMILIRGLIAGPAVSL